MQEEKSFENLLTVNLQDLSMLFHVCSREINCKFLTEYLLHYKKILWSLTKNKICTITLNNGLEFAWLLHFSVYQRGSH